MGGAKKKSLSKMEYAQEVQEKKQQQAKKAKAKLELERKERSIRLPELSDDKLISDLSRMGAITPYLIAAHFNLKLSAAKELLEELAKKNLVKNVGGNSRIRIYQVAAAS
ncbi:hypothetical protein KEJ51_00795 [Candidatus Bathyarchaeota archaeon]|nr:hypothetical protein [Candidatus Bathyarchaeota archaeon]MBS7628784.1 hypothetical protein [Candidatus Bathyarchaeota archaeon]